MCNIIFTITNLPSSACPDTEIFMLISLAMSPLLTTKHTSIDGDSSPIDLVVVMKPIVAPEKLFFKIIVSSQNTTCS